MMKYGTLKTIWFILFVSLIIIAVSGIYALNENLLTQILFVAIGSIISIVQADVAYSNWTSKENAISNLVHKAHLKGQRILIKNKSEFE
jgi:membrane protein implicated in regulation of membrane protease activity